MSEGDFYSSICDDNVRDTFKKAVSKDPDVKKSGFKSVRAMHTTPNSVGPTHMCTCAKE